MWIKIEAELPIQSFLVSARNGKRIVDAIYYRKKWYSAHDYDMWGVGEARQVRLHKVTEWYKCPIVYPKIPQKDFKAFIKRSEKYRNQMQPKKMRTIWVPL